MKNYNREKQKKNKNRIKAVSDKLALPIDTACGHPYIQIHGTREISIEGLCRIKKYEAEEIGLTCGKSLIRIKGSALEIKLMDKAVLVVGGDIGAVEFER